MNDNISPTVRRAIAALNYDPDRDGLWDSAEDVRPLSDADHDGVCDSPEVP